MQELVRYNNAKQALAEYKSVDEVKNFRDKAIAIQAYAKEANDFDLERDAAIARVRAERKCGELLRETEKAKGAREPDTNRGSTRSTGATASPKTLAEMGLTKDQSSKWQKLAAVPEDEFNAAVNIPGAVPNTNHLIKKPEPEPKRMDGDALWLWGTLRDMRNRGMFNKPIAEHVSEWTDAMKEESAIIHQLKKWVNNYE